MPTNITLGSSVEFIVEFLSSNGNIAIPSSGTLTITYTLGVTTASIGLALTQVGSFFTTSWDSTVADYGPASYSVTTASSLFIVGTGDLRIIN